MVTLLVATNWFSSGPGRNAEVLLAAMRFLNGIMEVTHAHRLSTDPYVHLDALWLDVYHIVVFFLASFVILCVLWYVNCTIGFSCMFRFITLTWRSTWLLLRTSSKYLFWTPPYTVDIQDTFTPLQVRQILWMRHCVPPPDRGVDVYLHPGGLN